MTERLAAAYPDASIKAIDIAPSVGRLFRGPTDRVTFTQEPAEAAAAREPGTFDLVLLCDVLHHVPPAARRGLLQSIHRAMAPGATFVFKDWLPSFYPIHWACSFIDRYVTGDDVRFCTKPAAEAQLREVFGADCIRAEDRVPPWPNNLALAIRR